jgi:hypothetical protein
MIFNEAEDAVGEAAHCGPKVSHAAIITGNIIASYLYLYYSNYHLKLSLAFTFTYTALA